MRIFSQALSDTANILLDLGADPNVRGKEGWTALLAAAHGNYPSAVRLLLDRGADVNARCDCPGMFEGGGWTVLLLAIKEQHLEVVETLLAKGANVNQRNNRGEGALLLAARNFDEKLFFTVLDSKVDVNEKGDGEQTALMALAAGTRWPDEVVDHPDAVRALLQKGAQINAKDNAGRTALMLAAQSGSTSVVRALLGKGARVNDKDAAGKTPLDFARKSSNAERAAEVIQLLQRPGTQ